MVPWFWVFVTCAGITYSLVLAKDWTILDTINVARNLTRVNSRERSGQNVFDDLTVRHTISNLITPTVDQAKHYVHFAAASYCNDPVLSEWTCKDCLAVGRATDIKFIQKIDNHTAGTMAYIATRHSTKEIILTYRGSVNRKNFRQDAMGDLIHIPNGNGTIQVHEGGWEAMSSIHAQVTEILRTLMTNYPEYNHVVLTGHSLGGMMASMALFILKKTPEFSNLSYSLYTYGQPRTGNMEFAVWVNSQNIPTIRVVAGGDTIPHSMVLSSAGYVHHLRELWIQDGKNTFCSKKLVEDPNCSNSLGPNYNFWDHFMYWNVFFPPRDCVLANPFSYVMNIWK